MYDIEKVNKIDWSMKELEVLGGDLADDLILALNKSMRYIIGKFWSRKLFKKEAKSDYLTFRGPFDKTIRQCIYGAKVMALSFRFKLFDADATGNAEFVARDKYIKLLRSCVYHHESNKINGWGGEEATISHVYELAVSAWMVWSKLNARDRQLVVNMVEYEALMLEDASPRFDFSVDGKALHSSQSSVFYNSDVANFLNLASKMLDKHECVQKWTEIMTQFYKATFVIKSDADDRGYNVNDQGYIINYGGRSPYASSQISTVSKPMMLAWMTGEDLPAGVGDKFEIIYKAFYASEQNSKGLNEPIFVTFDKKERPCPEIKTPDGAVGGKVTYSSVYCMDLMAYCLGLDSVTVPKSRDWAKIRMRGILKKQRNGNSKCSLYAPQVIKGVHREALSSSLMDAYIALFIYIANKKVKEPTKTDRHRQDRNIRVRR